jgi:TolA-binding protein
MIGSACSKPHWKDGFCKIHHPDSVASRRAESEVLAEEKFQNSPWQIIKKLHDKIRMLESEIKRLKNKSES